MDVLTINIITKDKEYTVTNEKILSEAKKIEGLTIQVGDCKDKYEQYISLLSSTDSKYVIFYSDENEISLENMEKSIQILNEKEDSILCQKVERDNLIVESKEYLTGGMDANPLYFGRYIFKPEILRKIDIRPEEIPYYEDKVILSVTKDIKSIEVISSMVVHTEEALENESPIFQKQFHKEWYIPYFRDFVLPYVKQGDLTETEQRLVVYMIVKRFYLNQNSRNKFVLDETEVDVFYNLTREILQYIDDKYLAETRKRGGIAHFFTYLLLQEKYQKKPGFHVVKKNNKNVYYFNDTRYGTNCVTARIKAIDENQGNLQIDGEVIADYCFEDVQKDFTVLVNEKTYEWKKSDTYNINSFFGRAAQKYTSFTIKIPIEELDETTKIQFQGKICDTVIQIPLELHSKSSARISKNHWEYWKFADKIITYVPECLLVKQAKKWDCFVREAVMLLKMLREKDDDGKNIKAAGLRCLYWLTKPKYKKKTIWIYYDKLYKAGDNGEYLFRYNMKNHPEVDNYYIITKDAIDYKRLKKEFGNHILVLGTIRQKLMALHSQIVFATHASVWAFWTYDTKYCTVSKSTCR